MIGVARDLSASRTFKNINRIVGAACSEIAGAAVNQGKDGFADACQGFLDTAVGQTNDIDVARLRGDGDGFECVVEGESLAVVFANLQGLCHLEIDEREGGDGFVAQFQARVDGGGFLNGGERINAVAGLIGHARGAGLREQRAVELFAGVFFGGDGTVTGPVDLDGGDGRTDGERSNPVELSYAWRRFCLRRSRQFQCLPQNPV